MLKSDMLNNEVFNMYSKVVLKSACKFQIEEYIKIINEMGMKIPEKDRDGIIDQVLDTHVDNMFLYFDSIKEVQDYCNSQMKWLEANTALFNMNKAKSASLFSEDFFNKYMEVNNDKTSFI